MNLGEMNREQLMYFISYAQPDMRKLEELNNAMNQEKKSFFIRSASLSSIPKHITAGRVVGAIFASFGIAIFFSILASCFHIKEIVLGFELVQSMNDLQYSSASILKLLPSFSDVLTFELCFFIPFIISLSLIIVLTNISMTRKRKKVLDIIEAEKQDLRERIFCYQNTMSEIHSNHPEWRMIPEAYQSAEVLYGIYNYLREMRANNWKEAANLYEFEHRGRTLPNYKYQIY